MSDLVAALDVDGGKPTKTVHAEPLLVSEPCPERVERQRRRRVWGVGGALPRPRRAQLAAGTALELVTEDSHVPRREVRQQVVGESPRVSPSNEISSLTCDQGSAKRVR
jgi:hypothetical protein